MNQVCIANKKGEKNCKKAGDSSDRQERQIPKPPCESDDGVKVNEGEAVSDSGSTEGNGAYESGSTQL